MNDEDAYHGHDMYVMDMWKCTTLRQLEAGRIPCCQVLLQGRNRPRIHLPWVLEILGCNTVPQCTVHPGILL